MKEKTKTRIVKCIPKWNLLSSIESEKFEYNMNGWSLPNAMKQFKMDNLV